MTVKPLNKAEIWIVIICVIGGALLVGGSILFLFVQEWLWTQ